MEKCLHILPMNKLSGAEKMALLICKNMKQYKSIVVCGGDNLKEVFERNNIKSYSFNFSNKNIFKTLSGLKRVIKENDVKILHAHDNNASLNAYLVKKLYGLDVKVISHIHSCYPFLKENSINKKIDSYLRPKYDLNIACGNLVNEFYKENTTYFNEGNTMVLSNAIDINEIDNIDLIKGNSVKEEFNIPTDKTILGFVGRLCEIKGIIPFIKEFSKNKGDFIDCRVLLVGSGEQEEEIKELIKELKLEESFILTGFQDDVYKFYPIIDILILTSKYEGLPMVILEAMAFKKVIVSMDIGSISQVIKNGKSGYLIKAGDYEEFINRLIYIKQEKIKIKEIGENAFEYVSKNYNINKYCNELSKVYNLLID